MLLSLSVVCASRNGGETLHAEARDQQRGAGSPEQWITYPPQGREVTVARVCQDFFQSGVFLHHEVVALDPETEQIKGSCRTASRRLCNRRPWNIAVL